MPCPATSAPTTDAKSMDTLTGSLNAKDDTMKVPIIARKTISSMLISCLLLVAWKSGGAAFATPPASCLLL